MSTATMERRGGYVERPSPSGLADVVELILDKGLVIDAYVRVSLVGIEILTIDARVVVASVDTYLRFAEATSRLDLRSQGGKDLPGLMQDMTEGGGHRATKGALDAAQNKVNEWRGKGDSDGQGEQEDEDQGEDGGRRSSQTRRTRRKERA